MSLVPKTLNELYDKHEKEYRFFLVNEILDETRNLTYFQKMYSKHALGPMGQGFKDLYDVQSNLLNKLKSFYRSRYES